MVEEILEKYSLKRTDTRRAILKLLTESKSPMTAEDIYEKIREETDLSMSTVYRNLNTFVDKGIVKKVTEVDGTVYFQFNQKSHEHLLICIDCNKMIPIPDCPLEGIENKLMEETGYVIDSHSLEFRGICPECQKKRRKDK